MTGAAIPIPLGRVLAPVAVDRRRGARPKTCELPDGTVVAEWRLTAISEFRQYWDEADLFEQLGLLPA